VARAQAAMVDGLFAPSEIPAQTLAHAPRRRTGGRGLVHTFEETRDAFRAAAHGWAVSTPSTGPFTGMDISAVHPVQIPWQGQVVYGVVTMHVTESALARGEVPLCHRCILAPSPVTADELADDGLRSWSWGTEWTKIEDLARSSLAALFASDLWTVIREQPGDDFLLGRVPEALLRRHLPQGTFGEILAQWMFGISKRPMDNPFLQELNSEYGHLPEEVAQTVAAEAGYLDAYRQRLSYDAWIWLQRAALRAAPEQPWIDARLKVKEEAPLTLFT